MEVKNVSNSAIASIFEANKKNDPVAPVYGTFEKSDRLEISEKAKIKQVEAMAKKDLSLYKERISNNFYNKPDVIEATAELLLSELAG